MTDRERELIDRHLQFYHDLNSGRRVPSTPDQEHFVRVCRGEAEPVTEHEIAYENYRRAARLRGETVRQREQDAAAKAAKEVPMHAGEGAYPSRLDGVLKNANGKPPPSWRDD